MQTSDMKKRNDNRNLFISVVHTLFRNEHLKYETYDIRKIADFIAGTVAANPNLKKTSSG